MPQPPGPDRPPGPHQPPIGPDTWWSEIESRSDVAPPRTSAAKASAESAAERSPTAAGYPPPWEKASVKPSAGVPDAPATPPVTAPPFRPPVSYGAPQPTRKPYPIIILALLVVVGVGVAGVSMLSSQGGNIGSSTTPSPALTPPGAAPRAGPVPEVAPPAPAAPPAAPAPAAPAPQAVPPGPPLAPAPAQTAPKVVQRAPQPRSGKVRDEDNQRLRRAFTRYFCVHGELPASYCRGRS